MAVGNSRAFEILLKAFGFEGPMYSSNTSKMEWAGFRLQGSEPAQIKLLRYVGERVGGAFSKRLQTSQLG